MPAAESIDTRLYSMEIAAEQQPRAPREQAKCSVSGLALWQWWVAARGETQAVGMPVAELEWFLQGIAGLDRLALRLASFRDQTELPLPLTLEQLSQLWSQRLYQQVPVQYLVGRSPWRHFELQVSPGVLIPRPETESLIDWLAQTVAGGIGITPHETQHWADLGTGSGAIALGLATLFPQAHIHAVDISATALAMAQANVAAYGLGDRIHCYQGSWLEPLAPLREQLTGLVANPPYIPTDLLSTLQPEVRDHEPHLALDGGTDGLDCIRHLIHQAPQYLKPGGIWLVEVMAGQAHGVVSCLQHQGQYDSIRVLPDLAAVDRFVLARRRP